MNKRSAPRRKVVEAWKTGRYGDVRWFHQLECDHIEVRKRRAPAEMMACLACGGAPDPKPLLEVLGDPVVEAEEVHTRIRHVVASKLGVSEDTITTIGDVWDHGKVASVKVTLTGAALREVLER